MARRVVDLACVLAAALVGLLLAGDAESTGRITGGHLFWALVLAAPGCVALWWRRSHAVAVAVGLAVLLAFTDLVFGAVLIALFTVAVSRPWPVTVAVSALNAVVYVPYSIVRPDPEFSIIAVNVINVALIAITVAIGTTVRSRREFLASLREGAARAQREAELDAQRLRAMERERIAREMHDVLAHRISLVSLHAGALEIRPDLSTEDVVRVAGTIRASAHQALEDLREILEVLRTGGDEGELRPQPGLADIDALVAECRAAGTAVDVDNRLPDVPAPASLHRTAYRVIQEGLTNARKHAPGAPVELRLARTDGQLHVRLSNGLVGAGVPDVPGARSGLVGLAERVSLASGRLDHGVLRGERGDIAFYLEAWLPWAA